MLHYNLLCICVLVLVCWYWCACASNRQTNIAAAIVYFVQKNMFVQKNVWSSGIRTMDLNACQLGKLPLDHVCDFVKLLLFYESIKCHVSFL